MGNKGMSLVEVLIGVALLAVLMIPIVRMMSFIPRTLTSYQARRQANSEANLCLQTIERVLSNGKATTLAFHSVNGVPFSSIDFVSVDNSSYTITLSNKPPNSVHLLRTLNGGVITNDTVLASHVKILQFTWDARGPNIVNVTFQSITPLDNLGTPESLYTIYSPNRTVQMVAS